MDFKKLIGLGVFYFALISIIFFSVEYFVLNNNNDIKALVIKSIISGFLGSIILTYMLRRWDNNQKK
jgi:hypothetical protein